MKLMEYQGKELFKRFGIPVPRSQHAQTAKDVAAFVAANPGEWVLKSQVLVGGRGKAGGIKFASEPVQAEQIAEQLLKLVIRNQQNPEGEAVKSILVEEKLPIAHEAYVSITVDRTTKKPVVIVTAQGGMDVEEVAASDPGAIAKFWIDPAVGYQPFIGRQLAFDAKLPVGYRKAFPVLLGNLYRAFVEGDCGLVEINPLVLSKDGQVVASDAKVVTDENADYRHQEYAAWNETLPNDPYEVRAKQQGINNYVRFEDRDASVGIMGNGAGLVMGTMDAVKLAGAKVTNFLDVGGGAQAELVKNSYDLIVSDPRVKALFINIFGGITRCDEVARGIVSALAGDEMRKVPMVVRLTGTNEKEGRAVLAQGGFNPVETMDEGARMVVELAQGV